MRTPAMSKTLSSIRRYTTISSYPHHHETDRTLCFDGCCCNGSRTLCRKNSSPEASENERIEQEEIPNDEQSGNSEEAMIVAAVKRAEPAVVSVIVSKDLPVLEQYYESPFGDDFPGFPFDIQIPKVRETGSV